MFLGMNNTKLERKIKIILDFENRFLPTFLPLPTTYFKITGSDRLTAPHCGVEDTIVDGKPLFEYVEKLAKSQTRFFGRFIGALEKMLSTGGKTLRKANVPWFDYDRQL